MVDATVSIVNFNTREKLRDCLRSIRETAGALSLEVIVVDNGSSDGSVEMVRTEFPEVRAIATGENLGFGRGHNRAIAAGTGRALIVLNPDTIVLAGTFRRLVAFLDATADAGACGCTVLDAARALVPSGHRDHTLLSLAANVLNVRALLPSDAVLRKRFGRWLGRLHGAFDPHDAVRVVDWIDGACLVVRRSVYEKIGGFDENIFLNGEDFDWCRRIRQAGWKVYHVPDVAIVHLMHQSKEQIYVRSYVEFYRAWLYLFRKYDGAGGYLAARSIVIAGFAWRLVVASVARLLKASKRPARETDAYRAVLRMAREYIPVAPERPAIP